MSQASVAKLFKVLVFIDFGPAVQKVVGSTLAIDREIFRYLIFGL